MKITKANLLERIEALENENKQRGIGNQFMTLKCIQGNRHFTEDATYCASKLFDRTVITTNFGSRKELTVNTNTFGGYKVTGENQTAVFQVIGADVEPKPQLKQLDQSVFNGLDEKWRFAAVNVSGALLLSTQPIEARSGSWVRKRNLGKLSNYGLGYDASNWQNSLIERECLGLNKPQLKQLDQSVFDGLDERYRFAAICFSGKAIATESEPEIEFNGYYCEDGYLLIGEGYDTTNWQNSLIERDTAKELLEVDLSIELTGNELCLKLLNLDRGVMCDVKDGDYRLIFAHDGEFFISHNNGERECHERVTPINNQGEPLTASDVGL